MKWSIVFRTDASSEIGSGHVVRCLTLAEALRRQGADCRFITRELPGHLCARIEARGFDIVRLPAPPLGWQASPGGLAHAGWLGASQERDVDDTLAALGTAQTPDWLVVDHYGIGEIWERRIRPAVRALMVIDDLADRPHDCDLLLDQNLIADFEHRYEGLTSARCLRLLGPHYALLQRDYVDQSRCAAAERSARRRILVYFGGADQRRLTSAVVDSLARLQGLDFRADIVIDARSDQYGGIAKRVAERSDFTLHSDLPSLAPVLAQASVAIGASGTSSWERLYFGVPSIVVPIADNQVPIALELERCGYARVVDGDELSGEGFRALVEVAFDVATQHRLDDAAGLVDGRGAERIAATLCAFPDMDLSIRPANTGDEKILLFWANDPETRRNAFNPAPISADNHTAWFASKLSAPADCRIFILETRSGLPVGQIRFDRLDINWTIGYSLAPHMRGKGLGSRLIEMGLAALLDQVANPRSVVGLVKLGNFPSRKAFLRCGFREFRIDGRDYIEFRTDDEHRH
jgi:UDP-2,4-diacetamido-2,4,6-trideoxy-beta-L-altropyranose hydrolase